MFLANARWSAIDAKFDLSEGYARRLIKHWGVMESLTPEQYDAVAAARPAFVMTRRERAELYKLDMQEPLPLHLQNAPPMLFGDPPPGRSALDQKRKAGLL